MQETFIGAELYNEAAALADLFSQSPAFVDGTDDLTRSDFVVLALIALGKFGSTRSDYDCRTHLLEAIALLSIAERALFEDKPEEPAAEPEEAPTP